MLARHNPNINVFVEQLEAMSDRISDLYQNAAPTTVKSQSPNLLLPSAFKELGIASEELQVAIEELLQQNEELITAKMAIELERQQYQELFDFAPDGYLVTNTEGIIQQANRAAALLLSVSQQFLVGKPLSLFINPQERQKFRNELSLLSQRDRKQEWQISLQSREGKPFDAALTVTASRTPEGKIKSLRWLLRDITERNKALAVLENGNGKVNSDRPKHYYEKGSIISLQPQDIWQVCHGVVKLSTICATGLEVLVGLAGRSMVFGTSMTSLPIYQATAISDVELVCFSLAEIAATPHFYQDIASKINSRLRQTEQLLAVAGQRRVKDRLYQLLQLLKQEVGQPVPQGTRINVRFTHEELASACCTTRVTITRLLNKLQQQGTIAIDSQHRIIVNSD